MGVGALSMCMRVLCARTFSFQGCFVLTVDVNVSVNDLMRKTGMSLRRRQPQPTRVLHWLVHTYYHVCLTFLRQCPGVPLWHLGCFGVRVFSVAYIYISDGAATAVALGADPPEFRPVFGFAPNFVGCLLLERHSVDSDESLRRRVCPALKFCTACVEDVCSFFFLCVFGLAGTWLFTVVLVGARATLPFSRGA